MSGRSWGGAEMTGRSWGGAEMGRGGDDGHSIRRPIQRRTRRFRNGPLSGCHTAIVKTYNRTGSRIKWTHTEHVRIRMPVSISAPHKWTRSFTLSLSNTYSNRSQSQTLRSVLALTILCRKSHRNSFSTHPAPRQSHSRTDNVFSGWP